MFNHAYDMNIMMRTAMGSESYMLIVNDRLDSYDPLLTSNGYRSFTFASDRYIIHIDPRYFAVRVVPMIFDMRLSNESGRHADCRLQYASPGVNVCVCVCGGGGGWVYSIPLYKIKTSTVSH